MTKKLGGFKQSNSVRLFMIGFVIIMYAIAFILDAAAATNNIGLSIGNSRISYAIFAELVLFITAAYYVWKTQDIAFFVFLVLAVLTVVVATQLVLNRVI